MQQHKDIIFRQRGRNKRADQTQARQLPKNLRTYETLWVPPGWVPCCRTTREEGAGVKNMRIRERRVATVPQSEPQRESRIRC